MGVISSYFTRKAVSSQTESEKLVIKIESTATPLTEGMAKSKPRETANQPWFSSDDLRRYHRAFSDAKEFLEKSGAIFDYQRQLEDDLEMSNERLRRLTGQNESNVDNINSANTPTALEMKYKEFYDHARMDAVDHIETFRSQKNTERGSIKDGIMAEYVACIIFEEAYLVAQKLKTSFLQSMSLILTSAPSVGAQYSEDKTKVSEFRFSITPDRSQHSYKLDQSSQNSLKMIMKETAEKCDVKAMVQMVEVGLTKIQEDGVFGGYTKDFFFQKEIRKYTEKCCKLVWKLVCQTTPYILEGNRSFTHQGSAFNPDRHQQSRSVTTGEYPVGLIKNVFWPGLFDGSSGRVIRKTEVVLRSAEKR